MKLNEVKQKIDNFFNNLTEDEIEKLSKRYGEIMLPAYDENKKLMYSDQFGLVVQHSK